MRPQRQSLEKWVAEAVVDPDKDGKCSMIVLVHMVGQQEKEIHTTKFGGGKTWPPDELAAMFRAKATAYCQDIPGVQTFQLLAFYGSKTTPEAFQPFVVNVGSESMGLSTEAPTAEGRLQMSMRNEQSLISQVYRRQQAMDDYAIRMIEGLGKALASCQQENREAFGIVKEVLMEKALDDHNKRMAELGYERATGERKKLMAWIPALANQVLGREIFPQGTADTALVESIADSLTEKDIMMLATHLKPELMGPLASRIGQYMDKKKLEESQVKAISILRSPDPENDAGGDVVRTLGK